MKKTIDQQRADLKAKLKKLEEIEQAEKARGHEKFTKMVLRAAQAARLDISKIDEVVLTQSLQKLFAKLALVPSAEFQDSARTQS
jgi:hypothetical protein